MKPVRVKNIFSCQNETNKTGYYKVPVKDSKNSEEASENRFDVTVDDFVFVNVLKSGAHLTQKLKNLQKKTLAVTTSSFRV